MGGPSKSSLNQQNQLTQLQYQTEQQALAQSQADYAQRNALQAPAIAFNQALSSGDPAAVLKALAPQAGNQSQATATAREGIFENTGPGAARDIGLAQNQIQGANQFANLESNAELQSFDKLANIGSGLGSFSLQELGAGISAGSAASSANQVSINAAEQSKASTLGFLGNLVGAGGALGAAKLGAGPP